MPIVTFKNVFPTFAQMFVVPGQYLFLCIRRVVCSWADTHHFVLRQLLVDHIDGIMAGLRFAVPLALVSGVNELACFWYGAVLVAALLQLCYCKEAFLLFGGVVSCRCVFFCSFRDELIISRLGHVSFVS